MAVYHQVFVRSITADCVAAATRITGSASGGASANIGRLKAVPRANAVARGCRGFQRKAMRAPMRPPTPSAVTITPHAVGPPSLFWAMRGPSTEMGAIATYEKPKVTIESSNQHQLTTATHPPATPARNPLPAAI